MRADGLPYIPPCPACETDTPRFMTIGLAHWAIRCRDKNCAFQIKHESEDRLRELWGRMQPAEVDPIAEIEAMGGRIIIVDHAMDGTSLWWFVDAAAQERIGYVGTFSDLRDAAARLLARVRGGGA